MSSRALRKLRGEALASALPEDADSGSSDGSSDGGGGGGGGVCAARNAFAGLLDEDDEGGDGDEGGDEEQEREREGCERGGQARHGAADADSEAGGGGGGKRRKKKRGRRRRGKAQDDGHEGGGGQGEGGRAASTARAAASSSAKAKARAEEDEEDEVDAALRELNLRPAAAPTVAAGVGAGAGAGGHGGGSAAPAPASASSCLGVDTRFTKAEEEMRRLFGAQTIRDARAEEGGGGAGHALGGGGGGGGARGLRRRRGGGGGGGGVQGRGRAAAQHRLRRSALVSPRSEWPPLSAGQGLSMESRGEASGASGGRLFCYVRSAAYASTQEQYEAFAAASDPNLIIQLLQRNPYHVEALLGMAETYKQHGESTAAADLVERAIYACEAAFHPWFDVTQGDCRLDFAEEANKALFKALFSHCQLLTRRGTHGAAFEACRLLLALDPSDPMGSLLMADFLAHRARRFRWVLQAVEELGASCALLLMPNWALTVPLARLRLLAGDEGDDEAARAAVEFSEADALEQMAHGLLLHPHMLPRLAAKARLDEGDARWRSLLSRAPFAGAEAALRSASADRLASVGAERQQLLWKAPDAASWLRQAAEMAAGHAEGGALAKADWPSLTDWDAAREQAYPAGAPNAYWHLNPADFGDNFLALPQHGLQEQEDPGDFADAEEQRRAWEAAMGEQAALAGGMQGGQGGRAPAVQEGEAANVQGALGLLFRGLFDPALAGEQALAAAAAQPPPPAPPQGEGGGQGDDDDGA